MLFYFLHLFCGAARLYSPERGQGEAATVAAERSGEPPASGGNGGRPGVPQSAYAVNTVRGRPMLVKLGGHTCPALVELIPPNKAG